MKALKIILFIVVLLLVTLTLTYSFYGGFRKVTVHTETLPAETIVYEELTGDYGQTSEATDRIYYALLNDDQVQTYKGIGIYYDNPENVSKEELRFEAGCILENVDSLKIEELKLKYNVKILPAGQYVTAEFPFKGFMSIMLGIVKAYPAINKYMESKGINAGPMMEIYDVSNRKIMYRTAIQ